MSGENSALAALVTQAAEDPPDNATATAATAAATETASPPSASSGGLCGCLFASGSDKSQQPKLAAIVPVEEATKPHVASQPEQQQMSQPQRAPAQAQPQVQQPPKQAQPQPEAASSAIVQQPNLAQTGWGPSGLEPPQLGPQTGVNIGRKTLVLDLDETLVHSSFRVVPTAEITITVELEGEHHKVYVRKRPGVDEFMLKVAEIYEVVVYTASMAKYANPLLDVLDPHQTVAWRLFREACTKHTKGYMKDLSKMGRPLKDVIIIDNSPICYALQPDNAIPIKTWRDDPTDRELIDLIPILGSLAEVDDIPAVLQQIVWAADDEAA